MKSLKKMGYFVQASDKLPEQAYLSFDCPIGQEVIGELEAEIRNLLSEKGKLDLPQIQKLFEKKINAHNLDSNLLVKYSKNLLGDSIKFDNSNIAIWNEKDLLKNQPAPINQVYVTDQANIKPQVNVKDNANVKAQPNINNIKNLLDVNHQENVEIRNIVMWSHAFQSKIDKNVKCVDLYNHDEICC
jgi:hypothetical protein